VRRPFRPVLESLEDRLAPATLTVNSVSDNTTDTSVLTLRDAITLVNNAGDPTSLGQTTMPAAWAAQINTSEELRPPFGTNDTILFDSSLAGKTIALSIRGDDTVGPSALLVTKPLIINGGGSVTLSGGGASSNLRLFYVSPTGNLTLLTRIIHQGGFALDLV
jgi:hypothetical protein